MLLPWAAFLACTSQPEDLGVATVAREALVRTLVLTGEIRTADAVELLAPMANMWPIPIRSILEDGTQIEKGEVIAEFDSANLLGQLETSEQRVVRARADLETARSKARVDVADAEFAVRENESAVARARLEAEIPEELRSDRETQEARLELRRAELELEAAGGKLEDQRQRSAAEVGVAEVELRRALAELRRNRSYTEIVVLRAPQSGPVEIAYNESEGRSYRAGDNAEPGRVVARFPDYRTLQVEGLLLDVDQGAIEIGAPTRVVVDAYPDRPFLGRVASVQEVAQQPSAFSSRRAFRVVVELEAPDSAVLRTGMSARVSVPSVLGSAADGLPLTLARSALDLSSPLAKNGELGRVSARALSPAGWVEVEVGRCSEWTCIVVGLEEGAAFRRLRNDFPQIDPDWVEHGPGSPDGHTEAAP